jgi:ketosteroid isomerase-like protein
MSRDNVELVRRAYEAFNRRDMIALSALLHPEMELLTTVEAHQGAEGVLEWVRQTDAVIEGFAITVEEVVDLGDQVIAGVHERGRGKDSGIEIEQRFTHVWSVQEGRLLKLQAFTERAAALESVGLREEPAAPSTE